MRVALRKRISYQFTSPGLSSIRANSFGMCAPWVVRRIFIGAAATLGNRPRLAYLDFLSDPEETV